MPSLNPNGRPPLGGPRGKATHPAWVHLPGGPTFPYRACLCPRCRRVTVAESYTALSFGAWLATCPNGHGWTVLPAANAPRPIESQKED